MSHYLITTVSLYQVFVEEIFQRFVEKLFWNCNSFKNHSRRFIEYFFMILNFGHSPRNVAVIIPTIPRINVSVNLIQCFLGFLLRIQKNNFLGFV